MNRFQMSLLRPSSPYPSLPSTPALFGGRWAALLGAAVLLLAGCSRQEEPAVADATPAAASTAAAVSGPATQPGEQAAGHLGAAPASHPVAATPASAPAAPTATLDAFCRESVRRLPNLTPALCQQAQLLDGGGRSVQGRALWQRDVIAPHVQRRVLVVGGIHGDELSSSSLVFHWINWATETPSNVHWRFVPLMNPDGAFRERPTRMNARGVDLNRNFPTPGWDKEAPDYWQRRTGKDPRRYPGPQPLSEPESQWLMKEMERFKPDLIVSVHAPYGVLDFDGPSVPPERLGRLYLDRVGIFPGSLGNWGGVHQNVPVVTIELHNAFRTPLDAEMRQMWLDLLRWIDEKLEPPK